jgi:SAM-dependent methyltransferase
VLRRRRRKFLGGHAGSASFFAWALLALTLAALGAFEAVSQVVRDHNDFGDVDYLVVGAAWLTLARWAAVRGFDSLPSRGRVPGRRLFVIGVLLAALPYAAMLETNYGYVLNAALVAIVLSRVFARAPAPVPATGVVDRRSRLGGDHAIEAPPAPADYEPFRVAVLRFQRTVLEQRPLDPRHYDEHYFVSDWRAEENRYELETRRRIEGRNPQLIKDVFEPARVLDVGCGPGFLMFLLEEIGVRADGIDFSPVAKELAPPSVRDRLVTAAATSLPAADESYDLVICRELLEHLTIVEVRQAIGELCRVSSRFVYTTTRFHPRPADLLDVTTQLDVDPTHITLLSKDFVRCLFVLEGFGRRSDLERRLDWAGKRRVLVYERA